MIWKILFIIYFLALLFLNIDGFGIENTSSLSNIEAFAGICISVIFVFTMIYTCALGWGKRLISPLIHKLVFYFSGISFIFYGVLRYKDIYTPMLNDLLLNAMRSGMVPRHFGFQLVLFMIRLEVLIFVLLLLFVFFAPFYVGYYHYSKKCNLLKSTIHSGRKCFAIYALISLILMYIIGGIAISTEKLTFNIFDYCDFISSIYIVLGLYGYAFNRPFLVPTFWRMTLPVCLIIELLPLSVLSTDYKRILGFSVVNSVTSIDMIAIYVMKAVTIYMIYRYATTNVVFKNNSVDINTDAEA